MALEDATAPPRARVRRASVRCTSPNARARSRCCADQAGVLLDPPSRARSCRAPRAATAAPRDEVGRARRAGGATRRPPLQRRDLAGRSAARRPARGAPPRCAAAALSAAASTPSSVAVLRQQYGGRLGADPARAGQAVRGIAAQRDQVGYPGRIDAASLRARRRRRSCRGPPSRRISTTIVCSSTVCCSRSRSAEQTSVHAARRACSGRAWAPITSSASSVSRGSARAPAKPRRAGRRRQLLPLRRAAPPASARDGRGRAGRARRGSGPPRRPCSRRSRAADTTPRARGSC